MGEQAKGLAERLNFSYQEIDMSKTTPPKDLYLPGNIVIDDFTIVYPGSVDQLELVYKTRSPIKGGTTFKAKQKAKDANIKPLSENIKDGSIICLPKRVESCEKLNWYKQLSKHTHDNFGYIAYDKNQPVAAVEFLRQDLIPYQCVKEDKDFLFITCIYNNPEAKKDYRYLLMQRLIEFAKDKKFSGISVISGVNEPYPNGPRRFFNDLNFEEKFFVGSHLLKYDTDKAIFMEYII